ncbi:NAD(P)H-hydrate dehydratase [Acidicapsa acidisoli]|uniref:NAD(P)H-hydrate dehydratase n=1 Tax=Acidicapsa acidisoli TaxID=1615681 RepID=UPI0021E00341|nr:NAD(P)H-hydrate dehydratase [Acidicapsa acidisoli]
MKILSAAEMQTCDRVTIEKFGIPSTDLMRSAARAVADFTLAQFPAARRVTILCGRGNNGGDGLMTARLLAEAGLTVTTLLLGHPEGLKGDAARAWAELMGSNPSTDSVRVIRSSQELSESVDSLSADLILDAVVGTGFKPPLRGLPLEALEWLKFSAAQAPILAIDLPSGWDADSTASTQQGPVYPADAVVTFTAPKPAHVFGQLTRSLLQPIVVAPIGSPEEAVVSSLNLHWSGSSKAITDPPRPPDSNKGMYGHVLVVGGSPGKSGAPAMAALAALRTGAGLVTAAVTSSVLPLVAAIAPELMTQALVATSTGEISPENLSPEALKSLLHRITVLAIGPGLGTSPEAIDFALGLLSQTRLPAVADADALNALATQPDLLRKISAGRTLVLTPHPGEMSRLTGLSTAEIQANRIQVARDFAVRNQIILVLKGWRTLIAHPDGAIAVNTTGNPGMAKGGSGDLLTGMVASLLAQHPNDPQRAVEAAVYLHGLAADITIRQPGIGGDQHTLLATDSLANLHRAFRYHPSSIRKYADSGANAGYCWLQGISPEFALHPGFDQSPPPGAS